MRIVSQDMRHSSLEEKTLKLRKRIILTADEHLIDLTITVGTRDLCYY